MQLLELRIPPLALVTIFAACMWAVSPVWACSSCNVSAAGWLSAGIAAGGLCIALLGVLEFRSAGTTVDPRTPERTASLVVRGVYRYSRNPMYLGFLLLLCGWGVFLGSILSLLFLPAFIVCMNRFQIIPEERYMRDKFAESYISYTAEVRRWI